eukprot:COSAG03_NODE_25503_length_265_cov_0.626506_1_plen_20_part_10
MVAGTKRIASRMVVVMTDCV